ncbi:hypothetical protein BDF21DRAFT_426590 [Thamnidium elegans]|uniref:Uncharacterized protein n=1 Tax=Thamnidium elegans TaxID=101142 RepID=A0A8H7SNJ0_9FUNG|nr:hypothetical protein INT48_008475 [Thamnidium elegans]KAI8067398.1 hypothetical protein BDF21DRAFT_426590 [Thamnidium elegans]
MTFSILPQVDEHKHRHQTNLYTPSTLNYQENPVASQNDVSKHLKSLQVRLHFARFKLNEGWETSTLLDVEQLWKQKQRKSIREIPKPRFTQRDIIDKRVFIPSPGAKHAKVKKAKLVRTYSNPITNSKPALYFHHYKHAPKQQESTDSSSSDCENSTRYIAPPSLPSPPLRNSLDYLSYAIAMTENDPGISSQPLPDISDIEPNLIDELDVGSTTSTKSKKNSPLSSPITSAAKAIMMFINHPTPNN